MQAGATHRPSMAHAGGVNLTSASANDLITEAMSATPRAEYLPAAQRGDAYTDQALPIAGGQTNSQPRTVRDMLRLLAVPAGARVLDVGSGSGWTTAMLAHLVGPTGSVIGVEILPELVEWGAENLACAERPWARIVQARSDVLGWPDGAPYDRILVSAMATRLPDALVNQLAPEGLLVVPVGGRLQVVRPGMLRPKVERHGFCRFVPLVEGAA